MGQRQKFQKKSDQRNLMKCIQSNFRKFMKLRSWGWFIIIQKTRPLIGQVNIEQELALLEEQANATWGQYQEALEVTERLKEEGKTIEQELKDLTKQLESEQGNLSQYTERQAKAAAMKADVEMQLGDAQTKLQKKKKKKKKKSTLVDTTA